MKGSQISVILILRRHSQSLTLSDGNAQEIEFTPLEEFEFWLSEMEDKLVATTAKKPGNRVEACQLLATGQKLQG